jgi:hypothetical protein
MAVNENVLSHLKQLEIIQSEFVIVKDIQLLSLKNSGEHSGLERLHLEYNDGTVWILSKFLSVKELKILFRSGSDVIQSLTH